MMSTRSRRGRELAGAFALGALTVAGFAPLALFPLPILTLAVLLRAVERAPDARASFALGFAFGLGLFLAGVSWVYVSLHTFGAMPAALGAGVTLLFCVYLALFPALAMVAVRRVEAPLARRCLAFPGAWILTEWLRGWLFTGFPWLAIGYAQAPLGPLAGLAPVSGVFGVGLASVLSAGLLWHLLASGRNAWLRRPALAALIVLWTAGAVLKTIAWTTPAGEPVTVSLLQGNVPQDMKWRPEQAAATLRHYAAMITASESRLIILPETAFPMFLQELPPGFIEGLREHARARGADVLVGLPEFGEGRAYYNSVVSFGASPTQVYRKSHLVPFGEFIPLRPLLAPVVERLAIPLTDFTRGSTAQRPLAVGGQRVAINICYEDAFGEEIIRQLPEATVLVNVSNVAWFGDSIAPAQHLQIARMRALETGRYMLRATNTGMTAAIAPDGRVRAIAPSFTQASVDAEIVGYQGATPYVRTGNLPAIGTAAAMLALALWAGGRRKRAGSSRSDRDNR